MAERDGYTYIPSDPPSTSGATLAAERSAYKLRQRPGMHEPRQKHTGFVIPPGPYGADRIDVVTPVAHRPGGQLIAASAGVPHIKRQNSAGNKAIATMLAPQLPQTMRQRDKVVPLPVDRLQELEGSSERSEGSEADAEEAAGPAGAVPFRPLRPPASGSGRITVYCSTESLDLRALEARIRDQHSTWQLLQLPDEVLHVMLPGLSMQLLQDQATAAVRKRGRSASSYQSALMHDAAATSSGARDRSSGSVSVLVQDIFFFGYGVTCFWGFSADLEQLLMKELVAPCQVGAYPAKEVDVDEFTFCYAGHATPNMQNDTITISRRQAADHQVRMAISHALAQSTKLSIYEERVVALVEESRHLPQDLANHGRVSMPTRKLAQLIGKVFLQSSNVNLLSTVLDTPDYFWSAPDHLQMLYERVAEYLELDTRTEVLNARFQVLQEMLDMLRDHKNNSHAARLEWIIIWLLCIDVVLMLFQLLSLFNFV